GELAALYDNPELDVAHTILLKPADAKTVGAITFDKTESALVSWRTVGSSATWDVYKITPGSYTVAMTCGVAETGTAAVGSALSTSGANQTLTGGEVEFSEVTGLVGGDAGKLNASLKSTGAWTTFANVT